MKLKFYLLTWLCCVVSNAAMTTVAMVWNSMILIKDQPASQIIGNTLDDAKTVILFSVPFSIPGVLALVLATYLSAYFLNARQRFVFVAIFCLLGTLSGYGIAGYMMGENPFTHILLYILISLGAVVVALLLNRRSFYKTFIPGYSKQQQLV